MEPTIDPSRRALGAALDEAMMFLDRDEPDWPKLRPSDGVPAASEHAILRDESRWFARQHPFWLSALENRVSYVVGSGHRYTLRPRAGQEIDAETLDRARGEIEEFQERVGWQFRQQETQWRWDRDGEVFLRVFTGGDGRLSIRYIEPEQVATPPGGESTVCHGVELDPDDAETPVAYWVARDPHRPDSFERIEAADVQHRKANVDCTWPRGLPTSVSVRDNLRRAWKLLRNMTTVASIQAAVAIVRTHERAGGGTVQEYAARAATARGSDGRGGTRDYQHFPPGAVVDLPPGIKYEFPAQGLDVSRYVAAVQAELRAIAARLCMPEFMLSADASNANYASTMVAEGPAVKMFERMQSETIWHDSRLLSRVLRSAERAGRLPDGLSARLIIDAEAPTTQSRDWLAEAQADQILLVNRVVSPQSVAARHGYDYQQERDLMDAADLGELPDDNRPAAGDGGNDR